MKVYVIRQSVQLMNCENDYEYWSDFKSRFVNWGKHSEFNHKRQAVKKIKKIGCGKVIQII